MPRLPPKHRIDLTGPEMPADNGLSGLGLLMQLGGSIYLGVMALMVVTTLVTAGPFGGGGMVILIGLLGLGRSALHRAAGSALLYGPADDADVGSPLRMTGFYVAASLLHTGIVLALIDSELDPSRAALFDLAALLLAWPATLLVVMRSARFRRFTTALPMPEDRGFTGISIYMTLFGLTGAVFAACVLLLTARMGDASLLSLNRFGMLAVGAVLLARSIHHARAGMLGLSGAPTVDFLAAATRYIKWGTGGAILACSVLSLIAFEREPRTVLMVQAMCVGYLLALWPLLVRRFFAERGYSAFLRRGLEAFAPARDRGLTALGWLLLALGVLGLADSVPTALGGSDRLVKGLLGAGPLSSDLATAVGRSPWWSVLLSAGQVWAAVQLITMSPRHRMAGMVYGGGGAVVTLYVALPLIEEMIRNVGGILGGGVAGFLVFAQLAIALVLPVATLLLVSRSRDPLARARVVRPGE